MKNQRKLTASMIALMNVCAICNIKNFHVLAEYGLSVVAFLILSALFFFVPVALVSAELASAWPDRGVYTWVKTAFGPKWGFLAIWFEWIENVIYYPTILSFIVTTLAYMVDPALASNKIYVVTTLLITFWTMTFVNFFGMQVSGWISSLSALFGTILPIVLIIGLGGWWLFTGHPSQITFSWGALVPDLSSLNQLVLLSGVLLGLAGMEMTAVHAKEVEDPRRGYPRGIFFSSVLILLFSILGSLSVAVLIPREQIQLESGGVEAFRYLFSELGMSWALPIVAGVTDFGALGMMSTWIIGPSRGLLATAQDGELPRWFHKTNRYNMPVSILLTQAFIVTALSLIFLFMPSVSSSYWVFLALSAMLYMLMYLLMFAAALRLRKTHPHADRVYRVPGGKWGIWVVSAMGMLGSGFGFFIGFFPPAQINTGELFTFEAILVGGTVFFTVLPFWIYWCRKPSWKAG